MQYFVVLTKECNLLCSYCGGGSDAPPREIQYSLADLKDFLARDANPAVEFYGGEPLLRMGAMAQIMDEVPARFLIQTNGLLLDKLPPDLLARFHTILVSIDGTRDVTDRERGQGVYDRVVRNSKLVREMGFRGDLVARMTVEQGTNVYANVRHLVDTGLFDHVHWQLSFSMFWKGWEDDAATLSTWLDHYNAGVTSLVDWWVGEMQRSGRVPGIVPFLGVAHSLITGRETKLRCGSGVDFFTVMPDGRVSACPVTADFGLTVGSVRESTPDSLRGSSALGEPCRSCDILTVCGGRCLFVNRAKGLLREDGYPLICGTVRHLVAELRRVLPQIQALVDQGSISMSDFAYPEFNNGCEIIP